MPNFDEFSLERFFTIKINNFPKKIIRKNVKCYFQLLVSLGGMAGGQMLLNLSHPSGFGLFVLVSLLISLAVIPILLSTTRAPKTEVPENVGVFTALPRVTPLRTWHVYHRNAHRYILRNGGCLRHQHWFIS